jgi:hypothetical protein
MYFNDKVLSIVDLLNSCLYHCGLYEKKESKSHILITAKDTFKSSIDFLMDVVAKTLKEPDITTTITFNEALLEKPKTTLITMSSVIDVCRDMRKLLNCCAYIKDNNCETSKGSGEILRFADEIAVNFEDSRHVIASIFSQ